MSGRSHLTSFTFGWRTRLGPLGNRAHFADRIGEKIRAVRGREHRIDSSIAVMHAGHCASYHDEPCDCDLEISRMQAHEDEDNVW